MNCKRVRTQLSPYLDGAISGSEMLAVARHLESCGACGSEFEGLRRTQAWVTALGPKKAPPELAIRLRVALSRQASLGLRKRLELGFVRLENALNAFMLPATAGLVSSLLIFGIFLGMYTAPAQAAGGGDIPTLLYTPPQLESSLFPMAVSPAGGETLVVETYVDSSGRVQDYRILSGPEDTEQLRSQL
ncbi:MAG: anti-sigma factor family protein, partial [Terriglobales bacterium]